MFDKFRLLPETLPPEELHELFEDLLNIIESSENLTPDEALEILWELADKQWHTYEMIDPNISIRIVYWINKIWSTKSRQNVTYILSIIGNLGLGESMEVIANSLKQDIEPIIRRDIEDFIKTEGQNINNPYHRMEKAQQISDAEQSREFQETALDKNDGYPDLNAHTVSYPGVYSKHLKVQMTPQQYKAFRSHYHVKSGSYESVYGEKDPHFWENLPEYLLARCPLCGAVYTERMDTYGIEHWTLGLTDTVYSNIRQFIGCKHFAGVTCFINLQGKTPTEITYFNFKPEVPYVLPDYLPDSPRSYAVMHSLPICRVENDVFIPAYSLFLITYYSLHPDVLHARAIKGHDIDGPIPRPYAFKFDWDLLPWVTAGKLQWLDLEKENLPLKSGPVDEFPYANIQGRRKYFKYRKGEFQDALWGM